MSGGATDVEGGLVAGLAREFGLRVARLERIAVRSRSPNWRATCADGSVVLVKLASARVRIAAVDHPLAVRDLHPERPLLLDGRRVYVMDWREGRAKGLDALTAAELADLVAAYGSFRAALGGGLVHGDFNCNNVLFADGRVSGILDLEAVRPGHPCEDWARYALTGADRLPLFAWRRRRRLAKNFAWIVAHTGFAAADWRAAIEGFSAARRARKARGGRLSPFAWVNFVWRRRFHRRLERVSEGKEV